MAQNKTKLGTWDSCNVLNKIMLSENSMFIGDDI